MSRTQATALVLINWRGVFYERYLLDPNVTALEGSNGAGKTTVLIGCYVVLLPDMTRLRFTNLGEHGATGGDKGLWGRLGESGRPAYSVLELRLPGGERLLAGVHLERKAEPAVELTPFVVTGLKESTRLQDLLLERGEMDSILELSQLREHVAREGARFESFSTAKDYFATLFDLGVTPLRLATDADRTKLNEMLRTSMAGGISRALTSELRDFLLKEETGLADTLKRMRANLDACRRTRIEVDESTKLEQEIAGIYEAGQQMFAAALHAARERAEELRRRFDEASRLTREAEEMAQVLNGQFSTAIVERDEVTGQLVDAEKSLAAAREYLGRLKRAQLIQRRIQERQAKLGEAKLRLDTAKQAKVNAGMVRQAARREHEAAQIAVNRTAAGLADFQKGLEELHRRASEHQIVLRRMDEAQQSIPGDTIALVGLDQSMIVVQRRYEEASQEHLRLENALSTIEQRRKDFDEVFTALQAIVGAGAAPEEAFDRARAVLLELRELDAKATRCEAIVVEINEARRLAVMQQATRDAAGNLSTPELRLITSALVRAAMETMDADFDAADSRLKEEQKQADLASRKVAEFKVTKEKMERSLASWHEVLEQLEPLERRFETDLRSREALHALRTKLNYERDEDRTRHTSLQDDHQKVLAQRSQLEQSGGTFSSSLLSARDAVDGELLASRFEELDIKDAAEVEALLGPLAEAVLVDDPCAAAESLSQLDNKPASVWLVGGDAALPLDANGRPKGKVLGDDVLVSGSVGWRVSRIPDRPTLGRRARERRIAELNKEANNIAQHVEQIEAHLRDLSDTLSTTECLLSEIETLERGDPTSNLKNTLAGIASAVEQEQQWLDAAVRSQRDLKEMRPRRKSLRDLLPMAWLLDEADQAARVTSLQRELDGARAAASRIEQVADVRKTVERRMDSLRVSPESDETIAQMRQRCGELQAIRDELMKAVLAFRYVDEHRAALDWTDAEAALQRETALEPSLRTQLERSTESVTKALEMVDSAEKTLETTTSEFQSADATVQSLEAALGLDRDEWRECDVDNADDDAVGKAEGQVIDHEHHEQHLRTKEREITGRLGNLEANLKRASKDADNRRREREEAERNWQPAQDRWIQLESLANERHVLASATTRRFIDTLAGRGSANLRTDARTHAATLKERLSHARDSKQVLEVVNGLLGPQELSGESCLEAWIEVRHWLQRRIPAQIADVAEPLEALERLRSHLAGLKERLTRQETDLRGDSGDVARNIDIHIRRAQRQVNRLNLDLENVRFGSIHGVQIKLDRVDRMQQVLHSLRIGEAQTLLFQPDIPIELALDELFRRYGGRTTGQRLLDYREYVEPKVEVRRQSSETWEVANPLRMSTGEAIGIGAALMMVVLTAWERDANLLRPKRAHGTLRMLFLDEANRLSQDNLSVLFDLCQSLDLQLIIAAPEVARAEGNTTYRLIRRVNEHGNEEVIVTGRKLATRGRVDVGQN